MNESIHAALDLLDSKITDAQFDKEIKNSKFLRDCKSKGFNECIKDGLIKFPENAHKRKGTRKYNFNRGRTREDAIQKVTQINILRSKGMLVCDACKQLGVVYQTYYDWAVVLDLQYVRK